MTTRRALSPLYLAGFTTAFGAHGVAAALGTETEQIGLSFVALGLILAIHDIAEVVLKPVFGTLSDRVGVKPVIVGGLLVFAGASVLGVFAATPLLLAVARLGQGAAAAAFSPARRRRWRAWWDLRSRGDTSGSTDRGRGWATRAAPCWAPR